MREVIKKELRHLIRTYCKLLTIFLSFILIASCTKKNEIAENQQQNYFIANYECNNNNSYTYIIASKKNKDTLFFSKNSNQIFNQISSNWTLGQGTGKLYFDTGKEVLFPIKNINSKELYITIQNHENFSPSKPIVFWKSKKQSYLVLPNSKKSWGFGKVIFEEKRKRFITHIFECDTNEVKLYLAYTNDLKNWKREATPILGPNNFKNLNWNAPNTVGNMTVTPLVSEIIFYNEKYYIYVYGDNSNLNTFIGLLTCDSLNGQYKVYEDPILSPKENSSYSNHDVYYPKVIEYKGKWLMFYTSKNKNNEEFICMATSKDLQSWITVKENIIKRNNGWNQNTKNQLTAQVKNINDTLFIWTTGTKTIKDKNRQYNKGNVLDIAIGKFYSIDNGKTFIESKGNPIWGGNPLLTSENDHVGASFQEIFHKDTIYTLYHSKGVDSSYYKIKVNY